MNQFRILFVLLFIIGCRPASRQSEEVKPVEISIPQSLDDAFNCNGKIVAESTAILGVRLPEPTDGNSYRIHKIYNVSNSQEQRILVHLKDLKGQKLQVSDFNVESFTINFNKITAAAEVPKIDVRKDIKVVIIIDNYTDSQVFEEHTSTIYDHGAAGECAQLSQWLHSLHPHRGSVGWKACGTGLITL